MNARSVLWRVGACACATGALACAACESNPRDGYSFSSTYREDIKSVAVPVWGNNTYSYGLEMQLTEAIVSEIKRSTPWRVTDPEAAQTTLTGTITSTEMKKLTTGRDTGLGETMAVVLTVNFEWKDNATGRTIIARRQFESSDVFVPAQGYQERLAVGEVATIQRLAKDVVSELRSAW